MKKLKKLRLNQLSQVELEKREMNVLFGGCCDHYGNGYISLDCNHSFPSSNGGSGYGVPSDPLYWSTNGTYVSNRI